VASLSSEAEIPFDPEQLHRAYPHQRTYKYDKMFNVHKDTLDVKAVLEPYAKGQPYRRQR